MTKQYTLNKFKNSIDRACKLLGNNKNYDDFLLIKVEPLKTQCCCESCYQDFWMEINKDNYLLNPIPHEGDTVVAINNINFVLEQHESGPEIVIINFVTSLAANAVWSWITNFVNQFSQNTKNESGVVISKQYIKLGNLEYKILEIKEPHLIAPNVLVEFFKN